MLFEKYKHIELLEEITIPKNRLGLCKGIKKRSSDEYTYTEKIVNVKD
jgi:hypothetical protein